MQGVIVFTGSVAHNTRITINRPRHCLDRIPGRRNDRIVQQNEYTDYTKEQIPFFDQSRFLPLGESEIKEEMLYLQAVD